jgi:hypothetical protein
MGRRVGMDDMQKSLFLFLPGLELRPLGRPARNSGFVPTALPRFLGLICS